jgi:hypothetical protein
MHLEKYILGNNGAILINPQAIKSSAKPGG